MYNIIDNVYLFTCIMGKLHNIATGVMITWAILGMGKEAFSQTTGNSNGKANVGQVQDSTKSQIIWLDQYDYKKMLYMDISLLSPEVVKKVTLDRINEIRKEHKLSILKYDTKIEEVAYEFSQEKNGTERRKDDRSHANKKNEWQYARFKRHWLTDYIKMTKVNWKLEWLEENIIGVNQHGSVYDIMITVKWSPRHRENIISPYINSIWIWYDKNFDTMVQNFAYVK